MLREEDAFGGGEEGWSSVSWMFWGVWDEVEWRENMPEEGQAEEGGRERSLSLSAPFKVSLMHKT